MFTFRNVRLDAYKGDFTVMTYAQLRYAVAGIVGFMLDYGSFGFVVEVVDERRRQSVSKIRLTDN